MTRLDNTKVIVNLSGKELDEAKKDVLSLGLNFAVTLKKVERGTSLQVQKL